MRIFLRSLYKKSTHKLRFVLAKLANWRAAGVIFAVFLAYALTFWMGIHFEDSLHDKKGDILIGFYSSWVASITFFTLVGLAGLFYSAPFRADTASYDVRVRNFFGDAGFPGLWDYAKAQMRRYCGINDTAERIMEIEDYNPTHSAFKVSVRSKYMIRNIFLDVPYNEKIRLNIFVDKFQNTPPTPMGIMMQISVDGANVLGGGAKPFGIEGFHKDVEFDIPGGSTVCYDYSYWCWHKIGEPNNQKPARITRESRTTIRNLLQDMSVSIELGENQRTISLLPGESFDFEKVNDATPNDRIFQFSFQPPT